MSSEHIKSKKINESKEKKEYAATVTATTINQNVFSIDE